MQGTAENLQLMRFFFHDLPQNNRIYAGILFFSDKYNH